MKFVTVMDMWLLIMNIGMLAALIYVIKQLLRLFQEFHTFRQAELIDKELKFVIQLIKEVKQDIDTLGDDSFKSEFLDDLIYKVEARRTKNIITGTTPK